MRPVSVPEPEVFLPYLQPGSQDSESIRQFSSQLSTSGEVPSSQEVAKALLIPSASRQPFVSGWTASAKFRPGPPRTHSILSPASAFATKQRGTTALSRLIKPRMSLEHAHILSKAEAALAERQAPAAVRMQLPTSPGLVNIPSTKVVCPD